MRLATLLLVVFLCGGPAWTQSVTVAAAADLNAPLTELATQYEKRAGVEIKLVFGSSGSLFTQIQNGAPFDLFLSADEDYPDLLAKSGLAASSSVYRYAVGKLVLWVPASSALDVQHRGINILLDPSVKKIAIANPQHAPYGRAARAALRHFGLYDKVAERLVLGENVSQAAQFAESGSAQVGLIALSHAIAPGIREKGRYWQLPGSAYPALNQALVVLSHSAHKKEAASFVEFLKSPQAVATLKEYGFAVPGEQ